MSLATPLPNTIEALHQALLDRAISFDDAIQWQHTRFCSLAATLHAVTLEADLVDPDRFVAQQPLSGVAMAHKDIFDLPSRAPGLGRDRGHQDQTRHLAFALQAVSEAGALNFGALAMAEDACSATGYTRHLPVPSNPIDRRLAVGGSSSGCAVAVASGMVYASLGTDTAGSVRMPAMTCGVMGLKTTHGLVCRQGMAALSPTLDSIGVLARSTQDLALVLEVLVKASSNQGQTCNLTSCDREPSRIGYWLDGLALDEQVLPVVKHVMHTYGTISLQLGEHEQRASLLQQLVMAYETGQTHRDRIVRGLACKEVVDLGTLGLAMPHEWYLGALKARAVCLQAFVQDVMAKVDVLILPLQVASLPMAAEVYPGGESFDASKLLALHRFTGWLNYLGLPALSLPVGKDRQGLPVSVQLVARPYGERQLLALARRMQFDIHGEQGILPVPVI